MDFTRLFSFCSCRKAEITKNGVSEVVDYSNNTYVYAQKKKKKKTEEQLDSIIRVFYTVVDGGAILNF